MRDKSSVNRIASLLLLAILLSFDVLIALFSARADKQGDFAIFYASAKNFFRSMDIYTQVPIDEFTFVSDELKELIGLEFLYPNLNPPFQTIIFLPLALLPIRSAYLVWSILSILLGLASAKMIASSDSNLVESNKPDFWVAVMLFVFFPAIATIGEGQITFLVLFLLTIVWTASRSGNDRLAGIALGIGINIKLFLGLFLILFLVQRRKKLLAWCLASWLATSIMALLVFGIDTYLHYLEILSGISWYSYTWNASFKGFFARMFEGNPGPGYPLPLPVQDIATYACSLLALLILIWAARPPQVIFSKVHFDLSFGLAVVLMLLVSPFGWLYSFPLLILPAVVIIRDSSKLGVRFPIVLVGILWIIQAIGPYFPDSDNALIYKYIQLGFSTYLLVILSALLIWQIHLQTNSSTARVVGTLA